MDFGHSLLLFVMWLKWVLENVPYMYVMFVVFYFMPSGTKHW